MELPARYINDRFLPDKAIDLMDEAASRVRMEQEEPSEELKSLEEKLNALAKESPIETIIASSYQAVSGAGKGGIDELNNEVKALSEGKHLEPKVFQYQIAYNIIPQIGGEAFEATPARR